MKIVQRVKPITYFSIFTTMFSKDEKNACSMFNERQDEQAHFQDYNFHHTI